VLVLAIPFPGDTLELIGLPLIAGGFLYIAAADLVPELHHHAGGRYLAVVLASLILGATGMAALLLLEA
jgi:zinc transporter ZupT